MITKTRLAAGNYRYNTPIGGFGVTSTTDGWTLAQYTPEHGTIVYGTYPTQRELETDLASLVA